ncbi:MAPEG family protein [Sulfitobacter sp. S190]|uniref:MAPEG family protein n=1 Tax=Sulfitobacter sp. S190 TaxID=2867022 RepID=UPI0021A4F18C|nr:MAPEG family protein [Sulfitobacter sp. S190]UWR21212.1 MAPEG family protein [Sulfitobacter sp. S190]
METLISITFWNVILLGALLLLQPLVRDIKVGFKYTISNFDERVDEGIFANRLAMVRSNQIEALMLWVPIVLLAVIVIPDLSHPHLGLIARVFLAARLAYVAVSLAGIPLLRSGAWTVGYAAWAYLAWIVFTGGAA